MHRATHWLRWITGGNGEGRMDEQAKNALRLALDEIADAHYQACNAIHDFSISVEASLCKALGASPDEASKAFMERFTARQAENARKFRELGENSAVMAETRKAFDEFFEDVSR